MIDPDPEFHQCLFTTTWTTQASKPFWLSSLVGVTPQVIYGSHCVQAMKHASKRIQPGFQTRGSPKQGYQRSLKCADVLPKFVNNWKFLPTQQSHNMYMYVLRTCWFDCLIHINCKDKDSCISCSISSDEWTNFTSGGITYLYEWMSLFMNNGKQYWTWQDSVVASVSYNVNDIYCSNDWNPLRCCKSVLISEIQH